MPKTAQVSQLGHTLEYLWILTRIDNVLKFCWDFCLDTAGKEN